VPDIGNVKPRELDKKASDFGQDLGAGYWMNGCRILNGAEGGGVGGLTGKYWDLGAVEEGFADGGCRILDGAGDGGFLKGFVNKSFCYYVKENKIDYE